MYSKQVFGSFFFCEMLNDLFLAGPFLSFILLASGHGRSQKIPRRVLQRRSERKKKALKVMEIQTG